MNVYHTTRPDWVDKVQDLKPGQHRRIADGRRASFNGKGYFLWDFREQTGEVWEPQLSLSEKLEAMAAVNAAGWEAASTTAQPEPRMYHLKDWPSEARIWLHQASLSNHDILNINAYWNSRIDRVVLPYTTLMGQSAWIARAVLPGTGPKYLFPRGISRGGGALVSGDPPTKKVVITEDLLSAYRVSWATGMDAVAAQGTSLDRSAQAIIATQYREAFVWLDPDGPGIRGAKEISRSLGAFDIPVNRVNSERDPKLLTDEAILLLIGKG